MSRLSPEGWRKKPNQITHIPRQKSNGRPPAREYVGQSVAEFVIIWWLVLYQNTDTSVTRTLT